MKERKAKEPRAQTEEERKKEKEKKKKKKKKTRTRCEDERRNETNDTENASARAMPNKQIADFGRDCARGPERSCEERLSVVDRLRASIGTITPSAVQAVAQSALLVDALFHHDLQFE